VQSRRDFLSDASYGLLREGSNIAGAVLPATPRAEKPIVQ